MLSEWHKGQQPLDGACQTLPQSKHACRSSFRVGVASKAALIQTEHLLQGGVKGVSNDQYWHESPPIGKGFDLTGNCRIVKIS